MFPKRKEACARADSKNKNKKKRRVDTNGSLLGRDHAAQENEIYTYIDETYIRGLQQDCGWCRDNGIIELIPIAVVQQSGI